MTPVELARWLGFPDGTQIKPEVLRGMEHVACPTKPSEEIRAFSAFLRLMKVLAIQPPARDLTTTADEARNTVTARYGALCPECGISWWKPSPKCPRKIRDLHPLEERKPV